MYYPCSENKGADQLCGYREADLRLCFRLCRLLVFPCGGSFTNMHSLIDISGHFGLFFFRFPNYTFLNDQSISKSAGLSSRYSETSVRGVVTDIHILSLCDFLVCTFSSQVFEPRCEKSGLRGFRPQARHKSAYTVSVES